MTCYHPLHAFQDGVNLKSGKPNYKITSNKVKSVMFDPDTNHWYMSEDPNKYLNNEYIDIPCSKCIGCRLDYSRSWATRCMLEAQYFTRSMFLTITYDDVHVPHSSYDVPETGEIKDILTLSPRDFTLFMKRLRYYYSEKFNKELRYFACGEYGSTSLRPHYHVIVFGLDLDDLIEVKKSRSGFPLYQSDLVDKAWNKGYVLLSDNNWQTAAYTARYIMKKQKGEDAYIYEEFNIEPEFVRMSRMPGIGRQYYDDHKHEIYKNDEIIFNDGMTVKPPKYFDDLYSKEYPELFEQVREKRIQAAKISDSTKEVLYGDKYLRLEREEVNKKKSISKLVREL